MAISGSDDGLTKNRMQLETLPPTLSPHLGIQWCLLSTLELTI